MEDEKELAVLEYRLPHTFAVLWYKWLRLTCLMSGLLLVASLVLLVWQWAALHWYLWLGLLVVWLWQQHRLLRAMTFVSLPSEKLWEWLKAMPEWSQYYDCIAAETDSRLLRAQAEALLQRGLATGYTLGWLRVEQPPPAGVLEQINGHTVQDYLNSTAPDPRP